jgi:hypothetical protein
MIVNVYNTMPALAALVGPIVLLEVRLLVFRSVNARYSAALSNSAASYQRMIIHSARMHRG